MKKYFTRISLLLLLLFVSAFSIYFFYPKPPLYQGLSYSTGFYDSQGHLLRLTLNHEDKFRVFTPLEQISPLLIESTLLQEDQYFYHHPGVNPWSLTKAAFQTYVLKSRRMGASTITMQLARLRYHLQTKTIKGKILQLFLALELERYYSKREILETYLNLAPYGQNIEGAGAASLVYFHKPVKALNLAQALTLSIIPQNPHKRQANNPALKQIRNALFQRWITIHPNDKQQQPLMDLPLQLYTLENLPFKAPHLINSLLQRPLTTQANVNTTLDSAMQLLVEKITKDYLQHHQRLGINNAAVLLLDSENLNVLAALGSGNFLDKSISGQINGNEIKRSPGSALKPFIYGLALDQGLIHPLTMLKDVPRQFSNYNPENFDYQFHGPISAQNALIYSRNIPAVDLANQLNNPDLHQLLVEAEISQLKPSSQYGLALALGGAEVTMTELASLYALLVREGYWQPLRFEKTQSLPPPKPLLSREAAYLVVDMLLHTPHPKGAPRLTTPIAWKTGTSSGYRDAWSVGLFSHFVLVVWLGNFDNSSNQALIGRDLAAPLLFRIAGAMEKELGQLLPLDHNPRNLNLTRIDVCKASGLLPTPYCKDRQKTWFIPGKSPIKTDTVFREVLIDNKTGLRTCHYDKDTRFAIYEFWPSDLARIFKQAGIQRKAPPAYESGCLVNTNKSITPIITSPNQDLVYIVKASTREAPPIPLNAVTDGDVRLLYWFIDENFLGKTSKEEILFWPGSPGQHRIRVVDDHGLSDVKDVMVKIAG